MDARYRIWIVRYEGLSPGSPHDIPPNAIALELAEQGTMALPLARRYVEAFNRAVERRARKVWAVAVPVQIVYAGEPQPGEVLSEGTANGRR